eukprot:scaffold1431_cov167-Ochromonas_danica.AAC.16
MDFGERQDSTSSAGYSLGSHLSRNTVVKAIAPWLEEDSSLLPHEEAAVLLEYAREGQELTRFELSKRSRLCYQFRVKNQVLFRVVAWLLLLLYLFTRPDWTRHVSDWQDGSVFPSFEMPYLPLWASTFLEMVGLVILWSAVGMELGYKLQTRNGYMTLLFFAVMTLESLQTFVSLIFICADKAPSINLGATRPLLVLLVERKFENYLGYLFRLLPKFVFLLVPVATMVCAYTALGFQIFSPSSPEARLYFDSYGNAVWNMFMVMNSSNWPSPMIPAINENRGYFFYFLVFILVADWGMLNLVLGFVYMFFRIEQEDITSHYERNKTLYLNRAFHLLDVEQQGMLSYKRMDTLLEELYNCYVQTLSKPSAEERRDLILLLNKSSKDEMITLDDFMQVIEKCHKHALKEMRANRMRFVRFMRVKMQENGQDLSFSEQNSPALMSDIVSSQSQSLSQSFLPRVHSLDPRMVKDANGKVESDKASRVTWFWEMFEVAKEKERSSIKQKVDEEEKDEEEETKTGNHPRDSTSPLPSIVVNSESDFQNSRRSRQLSISMQRTMSEATAYGRIKNQKLLERYYQEALVLGGSDYDYSAPHKEETKWLICRLLPSKISIYIDTKMFDVVVDTILVILAFCMFIDTTKGGLVIAYTLISCLEVLLKLAVKGIHRYKRSTKNTFDGTVTALILFTIIICGGISSPIAPNVFILWTAFRASSHILFLLLVTFITLCFFAALGMSVFGGTLRKEGGNSADISATSYGIQGYWPQNFNDMLSGMVTMFTLLHVNNMHITTAGLVAATNQSAEIFFAAWYCLGVLLLLNVIIAVFLSHFVEYLQIMQDAQAAEIVTDEMKEPEPESDYKPPTNNTNGQEDDGESKRVNTGDDSVPVAVNSDVVTDTEKEQTLPFTPPPASRGHVSATPGGINIARLHEMEEGYTLRRSSNLSSTFNDNDRALTGLTLYLRKHDQTSSHSYENSQNEALRPQSYNTFAQSLFASPAEREKLFQKLQAHTPRGKSYIKEAKRSVKKGPNPSKANSRHSVDDIVVRDGSQAASVFSKDSSSQNTQQSRYGSTDTDKTTSVEKRNRHFFSYSFTDDSQLEAYKRAQKDNLGASLLQYELSPQEFSKRENRVVDHRRYAASFVEPSTYEEHDPSQSEEDEDDFNGLHHDMDEPIYVDLELRVHKVSNPLHSQPENKGKAEQADTLTTHIVHEAMKRNAEKNSGSYSLPMNESVLKHEDNIAKQIELHHLSVEPLSVNLYNLIYGHSEMSNVEKAAILVQFAREGDEHSIFTSKRSLYCYKLRNKFSNLFRLLSFVYVMLRIWERPYWSYGKDEWDNDYIYPNSGMDVLPESTMLIIKLPIVTVLLIGLLLEWGYKESGSLSQAINPNRVVRWLLIGFSIYIIILLLYSAGSGLTYPKLVTISSEGGILFVLWFNRRSLSKFRLVINVVPRFCVLLFIFFVVVVVFAFFGPPIYGLEDVAADDDTNNQYFDTFTDSLWSVFVAITSSSFPNQIMPSYRQYRDVCIYFITFITVGSFWLLNIILVVVLIEFQRGAQLLADRQRASRQILLMRAFEVLDVESCGYLERDQVRHLLDELYQHYADFKKAGIPKGHARNLLVDILDVDGDGKISLEDFLFLLDVVRIKISLDTKLTFFEVYFPQWTASKPYQSFKRAAFSSLYDVNTATMMIKIFLMVRLILLPRNIRFFANYSGQVTKFARLIRRVLVKIATLAIVFLCTGYMFASFGMLFFGGVIQKIGGDPNLYTSPYAQDAYWSLNFNDFLSASMTLFSCLKVSDFDVIATGFTSTTTDWAKLYFTAWYAIGVLLFLNIIKAFFLGEFLMLFGRAGFTGMKAKPSTQSAKINKTEESSKQEGEEDLPPVALSGRSLSFACGAKVVNKHIQSRVTDKLKEGFEVDTFAAEVNPIWRPSIAEEKVTSQSIPIPSPSEADGKILDEDYFARPSNVSTPEAPSTPSHLASSNM